MNSIDEVSKSVSQTVACPGPPGVVVQSEIRVKGQRLRVPSTEIEGKVVVVTGGWLKTAAVREEELVEGDSIRDPASFVSQLKASGLKADLLTFSQRLPYAAPKYKYYANWENAAAITITSYPDWWGRTEYSIRKAVNKAKKLGVVTKIVPFDDEFALAAHAIYNECPVRQGKAFWHYGKDLRTIERELGTYLERSIFIGAYYENELIGFMKLTTVDTTATITQILCAKRHFDKRPNNALIAKAVEVCVELGRSHFIYGSFVYYDPSSTLTEFKRRNCFEPIAVPRYYIPLGFKGKLALKLGLHAGIMRCVPPAALKFLLRARAAWYASRFKGRDA